MPCPYNGDDAMNMVWHNDKMVHNCVWEMEGDGLPNVFDNVSDWA